MTYLNRISLLDKQTGRREETVFNTVWHLTMTAEQKGISPHVRCEKRVWLKVQTEFKTCHSTKVCLLKSQVLLWGCLVSASVLGGGYVRVPLHNWKVFSLCVSALIREQNRTTEREHGHLHACGCVYVCHTCEKHYSTICILCMVVVMLYVIIMGCFSIVGSVVTSWQFIGIYWNCGKEILTWIFFQIFS